MFSDFSCHSQLHEEDPPVFQTQIMRSNYCICNVPDHVFQSPLDWKCIFMYWKETETYISYFLTVPLGDLILHLCLKIRYKITHPFLSHKLVKRTHKGTVEGWTTETGQYLWRTCSLRTSLWLLLCASSLADYHPSKDRQRCCTPWKHLTEQDVGTKVQSSIAATEL